MPRDQDALFDVLGAATQAIDSLRGKTPDDLVSDSDLQASVCYRFVIIGEASNRITEETRNRYPNLPWRLMRGMRNHVIHEYNAVNLEVVFRTVRDDLPALVTELERLLEADWPSD